MKYLTDLYHTCTQPIDFHGQELVNKLTYTLYFIGFLISLILGILLNDLTYTLFGGIITAILVLIIVVPPWKFYRKNTKEYQKKKKED